MEHRPRQVRRTRTPQRSDLETLAQLRADRIVLERTQKITRELIDLRANKADQEEQISIFLEETSRLQHLNETLSSQLTQTRKAARDSVLDGNDAVNRLIAVCTTAYEDGVNNQDGIVDEDGDVSEVLLDLASSNYRKFLSRDKEFRRSLNVIARSLIEQKEAEGSVSGF